MKNKTLTLMLLLCTAVLPAMTTLADPAKTLEDAGLTRTGMEYVIEDETEIIRARTEIKKAQRALRQEQQPSPGRRFRRSGRESTRFRDAQSCLSA